MTKWDWNYAWDVLPDLLRALVTTVKITLLGTAIAMVLGLIWALMRRSRVLPVRWLAGSIVEFVRDTPLLVQVFFFFYVLPDIGVAFSALTTGILAIGLNYSAYTAEVYRAGIEGVPRTQWEAARALNFSTVRTWTSIVLPQAVPAVTPALGNYLIAMFKDTPILSAIGIIEMLNRAKIIGSHTFRYTELYTEVGLLFLLISYPSSVLVRQLERRFSQHARHTPAAESKRGIFRRQQRQMSRL
ncbi:MAG TPA: ectoine/hydroxyectoine ABC transporter permease subunit EhuD [Jatrophihabitans sp.]|jgi:polar amino acid transport system permease protein|nr:ectoine/hydroxyectoine ABC transporter permease subunit EhuD [Jatrophihabitans sp.]